MLLNLFLKVSYYSLKFDDYFYIDIRLPHLFNYSYMNTNVDYNNLIPKSRAAEMLGGKNQ